MGASGEIYLCENGHEVLLVDSRMNYEYYTDMDEIIETTKRSPCPVCNGKVKYCFAHYDGDITDCSDVKVTSVTTVPMVVTITKLIKTWHFDPKTVLPENIIKSFPSKK